MYKIMTFVYAKIDGMAKWTAHQAKCERKKEVI